MPLLKKTQRSFSGGQLDKDLTGRQDLAKYSQGCLVLENFKVRKQGNVIKRSGTDLVCDFSAIKGSAGQVLSARLVPLIQERESGLYILLTGGRAYIVSPEGARMNDGTWSRTPAHAESPSTLAPYSIAVPFADSDLPMLDWCQSGDTVFFAHRSYPPCKVMYSGGTLTYERIVFRRGTGTPPRISSIEKLGDKWTGTGGLVHVEYAITAVKDGIESAMSIPVATDYNAPWDVSSSIRINIDTSGLAPGSWDCFYIYKKEADVFGLIGATSGQQSFVDIASGFVVNDDLYPSDYTEFDQVVHLRESGNKFASVHKITGRIHYIQESYVSQVDDLDRYYDTESEITDDIEQEVFTFGANLMFTLLTTHPEGEPPAPDPPLGDQYSPTAQKVGTTGITYSFDGQTISNFVVKIGSLEHQLDKVWTYHIVATIPEYSGWIFPDENTVEDTKKWTGRKSIFSACPAKYFTAKVEYLDGSTWTWSPVFDCGAAVDQTNPGSGWSAISGQANKWQRQYSDADAMYSYTDAASVIARMDAFAPSVAATVNFTVPSAYAGKLIRKITVYGYTNSDKTTSAQVIINGITCYQEGAYVDSFTDNYITPDLTITPPKSEDHFANPGDYPGCVQLYSQRLVYAATANDPFRFWMSCTGDLYNFDVHDYLRPSDAISASTAALELPRINRMLVHRDLMMFADGGEWQVAPSSGNAITPSTIAAKLQSVIGCAAWLKPIPIDTDILFCDGSGETLMATRYNFASDGYESNNLSVLSQRIFRNNPIRSMAFAQFPESTVECVLADGTVASLVYMKEHDVCAWSHHTLGGSWKAKDVAANKSMVAGSSHCAFVATRSYDAGTGGTSSPVAQWAVLALRDIDPNDESLAGNLRMDAVRTVQTVRAPGSTTPTQPTLALGEVAVRVGEVRETDDSGETPVVTVTGDIWAVGCTFKSVIKTTSPEFTDKETAQMEIKNATESEIRVIDGSDFTVRQPEIPAAKATQMKVPAAISTDGTNFSVVPGDADCRLPLVGTNTRNGSIVLEHSGYLPLSVLSVTTSYRVEFANHANGGGGDD